MIVLERATILIVDDDPVLRRVAFRLLGRVGHRVLDASDVAGGIALLRSQPVDLIISDVDLPGAPVLDLRLARDAVDPHIPMLWTSGHAEGEVARRLGATPHLFLAKPFSIEPLRAAVRDALQGRLARLARPAAWP